MDVHSYRRSIIVCTLLTCGLFSAGCTPRIRVTPNPGPRTEGIRYYRPKPYLKVEPAEVHVAKDQTQFALGLVKISLVYMPDFSEEYALDVRAGFGTAAVDIQLQDGWNLTQIDQDLDSQTDENLAAAGDLIKAVGGIVPTSAATENDIEFTVPASDVPLGFYESVIGRSPDGRKQLYGFRYVGFLPYQQCPLVVGGMDAACCGDPASMLYGLAFDGGRMVFKQLSLMEAESSIEPLPTSASATPSPPLPPRRGDTTGPAAPKNGTAAMLEIELLQHLKSDYPEVVEVSADRRRIADASTTVITVVTDATARTGAIERAAERFLDRSITGVYRLELELE